MAPSSSLRWSCVAAALCIMTFGGQFSNDAYYPGCTQLAIDETPSALLCAQQPPTVTPLRFFFALAANPRKPSSPSHRSRSGTNNNAAPQLQRDTPPSAPPPPRCALTMQCVYHMGELLIEQCPSQYRKSPKTVFIGHGKNIVAVNVPAVDPYVTTEAAAAASAVAGAASTMVPSSSDVASSLEPPLPSPSSLVGGEKQSSTFTYNIDEGVSSAAGSQPPSPLAGAGSGSGGGHNDAGGSAKSADFDEAKKPASAAVTSQPMAAGTVGGGVMAMTPIRSEKCLNESETRPPQPYCGEPTWIPERDIFDDIAFVVLIGDSTMLRTFKYLIDADDEDYVERVTDLPGWGVLSNVTVLPLGSRAVPIFFFRSLFVSTAPFDLSRAFDVIAEEMQKRAQTSPDLHKPGWRHMRPLVVASYGPHDTSWLVFQRAMPGFSKRHVGMWRFARDYWMKFMISTVNHLGVELVRRFNDTRTRPVVIFREHFKPDCRHPKYAKNSLVRCRDLLAPQVVPFYRHTLAAALSRINVPVVSVDWIVDHDYCALMDAGHLRKSCKLWELQLIVQAFRAVKRTDGGGLIQGHQHPSSYMELMALMRNFSAVVAVSQSTQAVPSSSSSSRLRDVCPPVNGSLFAPAAWDAPPPPPSVDESDGGGSVDGGVGGSPDMNRTAPATGALENTPQPAVEEYVRLRRGGSVKGANESAMKSSAALGRQHIVDMERRDERSKLGVLSFVLLVVVVAMWFAIARH